MKSHWSDPEFDKLTTEAGTTLDEATRVADYKQIQKILIERGPVIISVLLRAVRRDQEQLPRLPAPGVRRPDRLPDRDGRSRT